MLDDIVMMRLVIVLKHEQVNMAVCDTGMAMLSQQDRNLTVELPNVIFNLLKKTWTRTYETSLTADELSIVTAYVDSCWTKPTTS